MSNNPRNIIETTEYFPNFSRAVGVWKPWEVLQAEQANIWPKIRVECLVVAAGGGSIGGGTTGGGGAGGVYYGNLDVASEQYAIIVGAGSAGADGSDSSLVRTLDSSVVVRALGGGRGAFGSGVAGNNGGSGGGGGPDAGGGGAATQPVSTWGGFGGNGFVGGNFLSSARGGGAGPDGWNGRLFNISGADAYYGGGGGRGRPPGQGGGELVRALGGGGWGSGGSSPGGLPTAGDPNTGGGAGGQGAAGSNLSGGSGIIIIKYPTRYRSAEVTGTVSSSTVDNNFIYIFTGSGTITFL
jgi:hypothetical protein